MLGRRRRSWRLGSVVPSAIAKLQGMRSHLVNLAPSSAASSKRAGELLSELDEWFDVSASGGGEPADGFGSVEVGGHIADLEQATKEVVARLDQIDPSWGDSLKLVEHD
jgi:hypothetical protein